MSSAGGESDDEAYLYANKDETNVHHTQLDNEHDTSDEAFHENEVDSSDGDIREGRFHGPDSSWRFYTQEERALAASLDQLECNDLSAHLYNTHAWKLQHRQATPNADLETWRSKLNWIQPQDDGTMPFLPHSDWTAWPLKPTDVARSMERWGVFPVHPAEDSETYRKPEPWKPSGDLQAELTAVVLRTAKERFNQRRWGLSESDEDLAGTTAGATKEGSPDGESRRTSISSQQTAQSERIEIEELNERVPKSTIAAVPPTSNRFYVPMFSADEDATHRISQPSVRHIIAQLDKLLIGLHKSREGHSRQSSSSRSRERSGKSRSCSRPTSSASASRKRKWQTSEQLDDGNSADLPPEEESETPDETHIRASRRSYVRRLGTRDWSEVLGLAALTGWNPAVLDRSIRRCTALFGETMSLRLMPEAPVEQISDHVDEYVPRVDVSPGMLSDVDSELSYEAPNAYEFPCPYEECGRCAAPFQSRWRLREHLKRKHRQTDDGLDKSRLLSGATSTKTESEEGVAHMETESEQDGDGNGESDDDFGAVRRDGFLQPITVRIGRSKDKRARSRRPRSATGSKGTSGR